MTDEQRSGFRPDPYHLDREWVKQPDLYHQYAVALADARRKHDIAKEQLSIVDAELQNAIRRNPEDYGLEKTTEASIAAAVLENGEHKQAVKKVINARYDVDLAQANVTATDHKKKALENLVDLALADYYAEPRASKGNTDAVADMKMRGAAKRGRRDRDTEDE